MLEFVKDLFRRLHVAYLRFRGSMKSQITLGGCVLVVAPHPDDEVIGCGGLLARLVGEGKMPHVVIMTGGEGSHTGCCNTSKRDIVTSRRRLSRNALTLLGIPEECIHELNYPDGGIVADSPETAKLQALIEDIDPDAIFVPHWGEGWPDHVNTATIVKSLSPEKTAVWEYCVWMWYYNVWRGLDWKNAACLKMTARERELKLKAMDAYITPLAPCGKPWSGVLPKLFVEANRGTTELYFKSNNEIINRVI